MKIIVWDIDDVLNDLTREWFNNYIQSHSCSEHLNYRDLKENPPHRLLDISLDDYLQSLDDFRAEKGNGLKPLEEILNWFNKNGNSYTHFALTSTPLFNAGASAAWLFKNFGMWFNSFNFIPSKRTGDNYSYRFISKASLLKVFPNVDAFIDDNPQNINEAKAIGIKSFLFPRPWNKSQYSLPEELLEDLDNLLIV